MFLPSLSYITERQGHIEEAPVDRNTIFSFSLLTDWLFCITHQWTSVRNRVEYRLLYAPTVYLDVSFQSVRLEPTSYTYTGWLTSARPQNRRRIWTTRRKTSDFQWRDSCSVHISTVVTDIRRRSCDMHSWSHRKVYFGAWMFSISNKYSLVRRQPLWNWGRTYRVNWTL